MSRCDNILLGEHVQLLCIICDATPRNQAECAERAVPEIKQVE